MKINTLLLTVIFSMVPGLLSASPVSYVMVTDDLYYNDSPIEDASLIFRMTIDDKIHVYSGASGYSAASPVVSLAPGDILPAGNEYFNRVLDWSLSFQGNLSNLGDYSGGEGGFRWYIGEDNEGNKDWYDSWAHLYGDENSAQFPGFWWNWNFQNPNTEDYLMLPSSMVVAGSFGDIVINGSFDPVPEPSSLLLLFTAVCALSVMKRKLHRNG